MNGIYPDYVPGPATPTVPLHVDYFTLVQVNPALGVPVTRPMVSSIPIPGTIGQYAPIVLAIAGAAYAR